MGIKDRLLYFAKKHEPNVENFAFKNFGNSHFFSIDQQVTLNNIIKLAGNHPELNMNWIFSGRGGMLYLDIMDFPDNKTTIDKGSEEILIEASEEELTERQGIIDRLKKQLINKFRRTIEPEHNIRESQGAGISDCSIFEQIIDKKNNQLFNAFSLTRPDLFEKDQPNDYENMKSIFEHFHKYLDELDAMGKHELYAG